MGGACEEGCNNDFSGHEVRLKLVDQLCQPENLGCYVGHGWCEGENGLFCELHFIGIRGAGLVLALCGLEAEADLGVRHVERGGDLLSTETLKGQRGGMVLGSMLEPVAWRRGCPWARMPGLGPEGTTEMGLMGERGSGSGPFPQMNLQVFDEQGLHVGCEDFWADAM